MCSIASMKQPFKIAKAANVFTQAPEDHHWSMFRCSSLWTLPVSSYQPRQQCIPGHIEGCSLQKVVQNLPKPPVNFENLFNTHRIP